MQRNCRLFSLNGSFLVRKKTLIIFQIKCMILKALPIQHELDGMKCFCKSLYVYTMPKFLNLSILQKKSKLHVKHDYINSRIHSAIGPMYHPN